MQLLDAYAQNSSRNLIDSGERRYSSVRNLHSSDAWDYQPATIHGYQTASYLSRGVKDRNSENINGSMPLSSLKSPSTGNPNYRDSLAFALGKKLHNGSGVGLPPGFENVAVSRNRQLQSERSNYDSFSSGPSANTVNSVNTKKYHSLPDISGYSIPYRAGYVSDKNAPWDGSVGYGSFAGRTGYEPSLYPSSGSRTGAHLAFDEVSPSKVYREALSSQLSSGFDTGSLWSRQPFEQFGVADKIHNVAMEGAGGRPNAIVQETSLEVVEGKLLQSVRLCIMKLLKLEGSDWLFKQNDGIDEDLIDRVAAREKFVYEIEARETNQGIHLGDTRYFISDRKPVSVSSVPTCGEGCVWRTDLIISFGVWCIHRILGLSVLESRPELWGKYTYVLNRLQVNYLKNLPGCNYFCCS
jgi:ethylene-insensitive protein 2